MMQIKYNMLYYLIYVLILNIFVMNLNNWFMMCHLNQEILILIEMIYL